MFAKKSCKRVSKRRAHSVLNKLVWTAFGEPKCLFFGALTGRTLLQGFWSSFARVSRTKRTRFLYICYSLKALNQKELRKTVALAGENHSMAVVAQLRLCAAEQSQSQQSQSAPLF